MAATFQIQWGRDCLGTGPQPRQQYLSSMYRHFQRHMNRRMLRPVRLLAATSRRTTPRVDGAAQVLLMVEIEFEAGPPPEQFAHWWAKRGIRFEWAPAEPSIAIARDGVAGLPASPQEA